MGYSISIPFSSQATRNAVIEFFANSPYLSEFQEMQKRFSHVSSQTPLAAGQDLGYRPKIDPNHLAGFHATEITRLNWAVCVWAAVKFGRHDPKGPYIYYDDEKMHIDLTQSHPTNVWANEQGVMIFDRNQNLLSCLFNPIPSKRITRFIENLNAAWEQHNTPTRKGPSM